MRVSRCTNHPVPEKEISTFINYRGGDLGRISIQKYVWWPSVLKRPSTFLQSTAALFWLCENLVKVIDKSQEPYPSQFLWTLLPWSISRPKTPLKRAFFMRNKSVGWFLVGGWGEDLLKKASQENHNNYSCPCPRVQLVFEADREGATGPTKTRLQPPEETFSCFFTWTTEGFLETAWVWWDFFGKQAK